VKGWPGCLRAIAAVISNIQEARKFTLGQKLTVLVSHTVSAVLEAKGGHWLSPQRFLRYQAILVEQDDVEVIVTNIVNPASFLSGNTVETVHHDCLETIEATYASCPDLRDNPMENGENWFTDGSSYVLSGKRHVGYIITTSQKIVESRPLPINTSAKKAEIIDIHRLELYLGSCARAWSDLQGKRIIELSREKHQTSRRLFETTGGSSTPRESGNHAYKGAEKVSSELEKANELADREAKQVTKTEVKTEGALIPDGRISLEGKPKYTKEDQKLLTDLEGSYNKKGWAQSPQGTLIIPSCLIWHLVREEHRKRHWRTEALYKHLIREIVARNLYTTVRQVTQQCDLCLQTNLKNNPKPELGQTGKGNGPGQKWQIDFTELPRKEGY